jgi:Flp pilus assembly protein TadD
VSSHDRIRRQQLVLQAEGYLELGMPRHALEVLARCGDLDSLPDHALYLQGECLRALDQYREALQPLTKAAEGSPHNVHVWLSLGWCYKRTGRLDMAIESLEEALAVEPNDPLVHYNLACYWSLAKNRRQALAFLSKAIDLKDHYRTLVAAEPDFDPIRSDPAFQALVRVTV